MTGSITPILPGPAGHRFVQFADSVAAPRRPLPLAVVPTLRAVTIGYGMSAMDDRGRIGDRVLADVLGWTPGTALTASPTERGVIVVRSDDCGGLVITPSGTLRLPPALRHRCQLRAGERLLLAADPAETELRLYPPAVLDELIGHHGIGAGR